MSIILKPSVAVAWIPNGKIIVKPAIVATVAPSDVVKVSADTLRKIKKTENVKADTLRQIKALPTKIIGDTLRKISKLENVSGDTLRKIEERKEVTRVSADTLRKISKTEIINGDTLRIFAENKVSTGRTVEFAFGSITENFEIESDCTVAQIELLGGVCSSICGGELTSIRVKDSKKFKIWKS